MLEVAKKTTKAPKKVTKLSKKMTISSKILWLCVLFCATFSSVGGHPSKVQRSTCDTPVCKEAAKAILDSMDKTIDPCDDFYQHACGGFIQKNSIPDDKTSVSHFTLLDDKIKEQLKQSLEEAINPIESKTLQHCKRYYHACMDTGKIQKAGTGKVREVIKKLGGWPVLEGDSWKEGDFDWVQTVFKLDEMGFDTDFFFRLSMGVDLLNSTTRQIDIDEPKLGLNRVYLVNGTDDKNVKAYQSYTKDIAKLFGRSQDQINGQLDEVLRFEIDLAKGCLSNEDRRNISILNNPMTMKELQDKLSYFPWLKYVNSFLDSDKQIQNDEVINIESPGFFESFSKLIQGTSKRTLANYIFKQVILNSVDYLPEEFLRRKDRYEEEISGNSARPARYKSCVKDVYKNLKFGVGNLYIKKYFNQETRKAAVDMVNQLIKSAKNKIKGATWMDEKTKANALQKADAIMETIGYPNEIMDDARIDEYYKDVSVDENDYFSSSLNLRRVNKKILMNELKNPIDRGDWKKRADVPIANAYYSPLDNTITLPAGILQGVFFNGERPRYLNFGGLGFVIGHEITHGFDDKGSQFDKDGNFVNWWSPQTRSVFQEKSKCIVNQYTNITVPEVGKHLNGLLALGENIADNGGIKESYAAYGKWVEENGEEPMLPGIDLTPQQLFWVSAANVWCTNIRKQALETEIDTEVHSPAKYRVNVPFGNAEDFIRDFQCKEGSNMNPNNKCAVW